MKTGSSKGQEPEIGFNHVVDECCELAGIHMAIRADYSGKRL